MARKSKKLEELISVFNEEDFIDEEIFDDEFIDAKFIYNLNEKTSYILDKRQLGYVLHSVESIVLSTIFAILANCNTFVQIHLFIRKHFEYLNKHIKFESGMPSLSTIKRVIGFINPKELEEICIEYLNDFLENNKPIFQKEHFKIMDIKSMDGKTANSSDRNKSKNGKIKKMNAMSLYSVKKDNCEATEFIEEKTNEIPTGIYLLKRVNIKDSIIVFDAMSTQAKTLEYIIKNKGHYVAPVKGNQKTLEENIKDYFEDKELFNKAKEENYLVVTEKSHGSYEKREYIFTNDVDWIYKKSDFRNLTSIGMVKRTYYNSDNKLVSDTRYYISDLDSKYLDIISKSIRGEWGVENKMHWYLDMVFREDDNKCFLENSQKNLNIIRKFCMSILKIFKEKSKLSMNSIRFNISMDFEYEIEKIINKLYE